MGHVGGTGKGAYYESGSDSSETYDVYRPLGERNSSPLLAKSERHNQEKEKYAKENND